MDVSRSKQIVDWANGICQNPVLLNMVFDINTIYRLREDILLISQSLEHEYISAELLSLRDTLFFPNCRINPVTLGSLNAVLCILINEDQRQKDSIGIWHYIHPLIVQSSKKLYENGHYADAACDAFIEINDRVKQIYKSRSQGETQVPDGQALMNRVFSKEEPLLEVCDRTMESGEDIHNGTRFMLAGAIAALRNPKAHANISLNAEESMRRLMFASMLMYTIDEAVERQSSI